MARDPNELNQPEAWFDTLDDLKKLPPPTGTNKAEWDAKIAGGDWYANVKVYANGRRVVEWYQRGVGGGPGQPDPISSKSEDVLPDVRKEWDRAEEKDKPESVSAPPTQPNLVTRNPDGSLATTPNPNYTPSTTGAGTKEWRTEGTPTGRKNPDGTDEFDNTRPLMAAYVGGKRTGETRQPTAKELEDWNLAGQMTRNPGGKTDAQIAAEKKAADDKAAKDKADADAAAERNRPTVSPPQTVKRNGVDYIVTTITPKDGSKPTIRVTTTDGKDVPGGLPAETGNESRTRITGTDGKIYFEVKKPNPQTGKEEIWHEDQDGKRVQLPGDPTKKPGYGALPEGAPRPSGILGDASRDMDALDQFLDGQVRSGAITAAEADKHRLNRKNYWATRLEEQQTVVNTQRQAFADQSTQRSTTLTDLANRRTNATGIANQASSDWMPLATKLGNAPGVGANLMQAIADSRVAAQDFVTLSGANRMVPEVKPGPALTAVNGMQLPGGVPGGPAPATTVQEALSRVDPSVAVPSMPNLQVRPNAIGAGGIGNTPAPGGAPPSIPMTPERAAGIMQNPVFRPSPPTGTPPAVQGTPSQLGDTGAPPVSMAPSPWFLAGSSRGRSFDPTPGIQAMINDPRYDNATLRQIVQEEYPGYPIDDLLGAA